MAHQITSTDEMFSTRMPTWHGLGVILPEYPTREEAQAIAHPWEPISEPVYRSVPYLDEQFNPPLPAERMEPIEGFQAVVRSDNGHTLGIMGEGYEPVKNDTLWDIAEAVEGSGVDVQYETAGSLDGGKKVWVLLKLQDPISIAGDPNGLTLPYYALQNSHDGSSSFRGQALVTRIVCANTAQVADMEARARGTEFTFRHTKNVGERIEEARQAVAGWRQSIEDWRVLSEHLLTLQAPLEVRREFLERFIPEPVGQVISDRVRANIAQARRDFMGVLYSPTCEGITDTASGLVAAATEYAEHVRRAHTKESRFTRSFLHRNQIVKDATRIALEVAV